MHPEVVADEVDTLGHLAHYHPLRESDRRLTSLHVLCHRHVAHTYSGERREGRRRRGY